MSENSPNSSSTALSYLPERPDITAKDNQKLPRRERLYNYLLWPKYFQVSEPDARQLERMKIAYNILMAAPNDIQARASIRLLIIDKEMSDSDVLELIYETKDLFGKLQFRNADFDRGVMRMQLLDLVRRNRVAGDYKEERLAMLQLMKLDNLAVKEHENNSPVVPPLPNVTFISKYADEDLAITESTSDEEE